MSNRNEQTSIVYANFTRNNKNFFLLGNRKGVRVDGHPGHPLDFSKPPDDANVVSLFACQDEGKRNYSIERHRNGRDGR